MEFRHVLIDDGNGAVLVGDLHRVGDGHIEGRNGLSDLFGIELLHHQIGAPGQRKEAVAGVVGEDGACKILFHGVLVDLFPGGNLADGLQILCSHRVEVEFDVGDGQLGALGGLVDPDAGISLPVEGEGLFGKDTGLAGGHAHQRLGYLGAALDLVVVDALREILGSADRHGDGLAVFGLGSYAVNPAAVHNDLLRHSHAVAAVGRGGGDLDGDVIVGACAVIQKHVQQDLEGAVIVGGQGGSGKSDIADDDLVLLGHGAGEIAKEGGQSVDSLLDVGVIGIPIAGAGIVIAGGNQIPGPVLVPIVVQGGQQQIVSAVSGLNRRTGAFVDEFFLVGRVGVGPDGHLYTGNQVAAGQVLGHLRIKAPGQQKFLHFIHAGKGIGILYNRPDLGCILSGIIIRVLQIDPLIMEAPMGVGLAVAAVGQQIVALPVFIEAVRHPGIPGGGGIHQREAVHVAIGCMVKAELIGADELIDVGIRRIGRRCYGDRELQLLRGLGCRSDDDPVVGEPAGFQRLIGSQLGQVGSGGFIRVDLRLLRVGQGVIGGLRSSTLGKHILHIGLIPVLRLDMLLGPVGIVAGGIIAAGIPKDFSGDSDSVRLHLRQGVDLGQKRLHLRHRIILWRSRLLCCRRCIRFCEIRGLCSRLFLFGFSCLHGRFLRDLRGFRRSDDVLGSNGCSLLRPDLRRDPVQAGDQEHKCQKQREQAFGIVIHS